ncbi:glycosyltransferase family 4 protein [Haloarchaeobius amylolyticus]|uniref:glycosyltransferase family 4 protein n=1 Tax=Haloarchaeobius amylolyticus TaxID=1198296 RepID=UPI0036F1F9F9
MDQTLQCSSQVIVGSPTLKNYARQHCDRVVCLPTPIPTDKYPDRQQISETEPSETITLGWIGNPQNLHYLASITEPLAAILEQHDTELHVITAGDLPVTPLRDHPDVTYQTWTLEDELDLLTEVDIGIRPLFDDEWTRGKGGYTSVVQKMALGIPVVATPVGMITEIIEHGHSGYHADSPEEWTRYVCELIEDEQKRREFGKNAHQAVEDQGFWTEQRAEEWVQLFEDLERS